MKCRPNGVGRKIVDRLCTEWRPVVWHNEELKSDGDGGKEVS